MKTRGMHFPLVLVQVQVQVQVLDGAGEQAELVALGISQYLAGHGTTIAHERPRGAPRFASQGVAGAWLARPPGPSGTQDPTAPLRRRKQVPLREGVRRQV